jgi:hypothetical protein
MNKTICDKCQSNVKADKDGRTPCVKIGHGVLRDLGTWWEYDLCEPCLKGALEWFATHPAAEKP